MLSQCEKFAYMRYIYIWYSLSKYVGLGMANFRTC